jgi:hypothetical protein
MLLRVLLALGALSAALPPGPPPGAQPVACRTFAATGQTVCGAFLTYWDSHGGLAQQGLPLSPERSEVSPLDGKAYTVQYFERAVFERHPENPAPYNILLALLGSFRYQARYGAAGAPNQVASASAPRLFPETGKTLGGRFRAYWESHGGLAQEGFPISNEFQEKSELDGKTYTVQYFERAVFEWHPENAPPFDVLLSQLGRFRLESQAGATPTAPAGTDAWAALRARPLRLPSRAPGQPCAPDAAHPVAPAFGPGLGAGPIYPVQGETGTLYFGGDAFPPPWRGQKVLWVGDAAYQGLALVRGARIDAPGEMRFGDGATPLPELRLTTEDGRGAPGAWHDWPGYTRLEAAGCYAYQVDSLSGSAVIVFAASDRMGP